MAPRARAYDVVILGGAAMGAAAAWFLMSEHAFRGRVLVVERDPSFEHAATSATNSCMRQQFSAPVNIRISQFGRAYLRDFRARMGGGPDIPRIDFDPFGYLYLATTPEGAAALGDKHAVQRREGVSVDLLSREALADRFPFMATDDVRLASLGTRDEGYFDGATMVATWRREAARRGVETVQDAAVGLHRAGARVEGVELAGAGRIAAGWVVNATGTRAAAVARMAGFPLPVEARKRTTFVFDAAEPLPGKLPLTIDPSGVHVRSDGVSYMAGSAPRDGDAPVDADDFAEDPGLWQEHVWPRLAARIPVFERLRLRRSWVGHYDWNRLDRNAVIGPVPGCENLILMNGFSGHGLQQAPAMGRGVAELIVHGGYRTLDLDPLGPDRILHDRPLAEANVI